VTSDRHRSSPLRIGRTFSKSCGEWETMLLLTMKQQLRRSDQRDVREIGAITSSVARDECVAFDFRVGADVEIRQGRGFRSSALPIFQKGLSGQPPGGVRQRQSSKNGRINPLTQIGGGGESRGKFGGDDRVDENRPLSGGVAEFALRLGQPDRVSRGNVQQGVRVEQIHSSPRVRFMTSSVLAPGIAAPRARFSQLSTGGGAFAAVATSPTSAPTHPPAGRAGFQWQPRSQRYCPWSKFTTWRPPVARFRPFVALSSGRWASSGVPCLR